MASLLCIYNISGGSRERARALLSPPPLPTPPSLEQTFFLHTRPLRYLKVWVTGPPPFLKKSGSGTGYCLVYNYALW